jgi:hypothetical protein
MLIRSYGRASSEIWPATDWKKFKSMIERMPPAAASERAGALPGQGSAAAGPF